jgi:hypothetical protein
MLAACLSTSMCGAALITAASTARKDVAAAIASARNGDTVVIPAGDSTWSSVLSINKSINLAGQGVNHTFLRNHAGIFTIIAPIDKPIRITGIYFDMTSFDRSVPNRSGLRWFGKLSSLRIDHCYFNAGERSISIEGDIYGVIDHCTFKDSNIAIHFAGADQGANSWARPIHPGGTDTMVVEDCTILCTQPSSQFVDSELYGQNGGRAVIRHNTIDYSQTGAPCIPIDAHGFNTSWGNGTRFYEIYSNTFKCQYTYNFISLRGGWHIVHDNTFVVTGTTTPTPIWLQREQSATDIPAQQLVKRSFFWNNTLSVGGEAPAVVEAVDSGQTSNEPVLDVDFFNRAIRSGDPWYPYTPLVYPHPRVKAEDGGKPPVGKPQGITSGS